MKVLVIGNGGREHALAWKIAQSPRVERVFVAPGNAGTALEAENVDISPTDFARLIKFAQQNEIGLTVVGPELPLTAGIVDAFSDREAADLRPRARRPPSWKGARSFARTCCAMPTCRRPTIACFATPTTPSRISKDREDVPVVVKADGLAAGKGVFVCATRAEAIEAVDRIGRSKEFGDAGNQIVIEERLDGQEASVLAITDGQTIVTLPPAQDHKRAYDGDTGPNTGGMGAYCPAPLVDDEHAAPDRRARARADGARHEARPAAVPRRAVRRADADQPGPQGAGVQRPLRRSRVPADVDAAEERPGRGAAKRRSKAGSTKLDAAGVGSAAGRVRGDGQRRLSRQVRARMADSRAGRGGQECRTCKVFHAGTATVDGQVVTNGGRVLAVTALGSTIPAAKLQAYTAVKCIRWDGAWCRKDISDKALTSMSHDGPLRPRRPELAADRSKLPLPLARDQRHVDHVLCQEPDLHLVACGSRRSRSNRWCRRRPLPRPAGHRAGFQQDQLVRFQQPRDLHRRFFASLRRPRQRGGLGHVGAMAMLDAAQHHDPLGDLVDQLRLLAGMLVEQQVQLIERRARHLPVVLLVHDRGA